MLKYIKYFIYLAYNWNIRIAWTLIREEIKGEKKYGINTTGADELKKLDKAGIDISHATIYMPVSYHLLEEVFEHLNLSATQATSYKLQATIFAHFLDIGCGKGRALCLAAHFGITKLTGIDLSKELCEKAKKNLEITRQKYPNIRGSVINNDAFYYKIPDDADCIFLFNPFDELIMSGVVKNISESLQSHPRKITVIYVNPINKILFTGAGFKEVFYTKKMKYLEVAVLEKPSF